MKKETKVKIGDKEVGIYVSTPNGKVVQKADRYRAKAFTECIEDGIKTKEELDIFMDQRKIWTENHRNKQTEIVEEISSLERQIFIGDGNKKLPLSDGVKKAIRMRQLRIDLRDLMLKKIEMEQNTAESLADNARFDFLVANCTFYENGERVYKDIDDFTDRAADEIAYAAGSLLAEMIHGYDENAENNLPENTFLRHFDLLNEDGSLVDEEKNLVDTNGRRINDLGHYIDKNGNRIDIDGNPMDKYGNYIIQVDYEKVKKPTARKRATKKKAVASSEE
jgi:hypothetical protein